MRDASFLLNCPILLPAEDKRGREAEEKESVGSLRVVGFYSSCKTVHCPSDHGTKVLDMLLNAVHSAALQNRPLSSTTWGPICGLNLVARQRQTYNRLNRSANNSHVSRLTVGNDFRSTSKDPHSKLTSNANQVAANGTIAGSNFTKTSPGVHFARTS